MALGLASALSACLHQPPLERGIGSIGMERDSIVRHRIAESVLRFYSINGQVGRRSARMQLLRYCYPFAPFAECALAASKITEDSASHITLRGSAAALAAELEQLRFHTVVVRRA